MIDCPAGATSPRGGSATWATREREREWRTRERERGRERGDRQARVALERWRAGLLPLSFSHCFCDRRGARGRIINSSPHSAGHSRVRYRPRGDNDDQSDDDPIEETWRTTTEPLPLPFPSPIVNYPAWVPLLRATANKRIFPSVSFFFFFFFFFFLPPPWWLLSFYTIVVSSSHVSFFSISLPLSLSRSIREARGRASRPGTSRFISIRGSTTNDHRVLLRSPTPIDDLFVRRDIRESGFFRMRMELAGYRGSPRIAPRGLLQLAKMDLLIPFV